MHDLQPVCRSCGEERLTPIYPGTEGVAQGRLRALITQALRELDSAAVRDWIPPHILAPLGLPALKDALAYMHRPPREVRLAELAAGRHPAQRRLAFEELLAHHLSLKLMKRTVQSCRANPSRLDAALKTGILALSSSERVKNMIRSS